MPGMLPYLGEKPHLLIVPSQVRFPNQPVRSTKRTSATEADWVTKP